MDDTDNSCPQPSNTKSPQPHHSPQSLNIEVLAQRIRAGDRSAERDLYISAERRLRFNVLRRLGGGPDLDDVVNEVLMIALSNIRAGKLKDHASVWPYIWAIARVIIVDFIRARSQSRATVQIDSILVPDSGANPEQLVLSSEQHRMALKTLDDLTPMQGEVLRRFYLENQTREQICGAMRLTPTQFRLLKSRAKYKFGVLGRKSLK